MELAGGAGGSQRISVLQEERIGQFLISHPGKRPREEQSPIPRGLLPLQLFHLGEVLLQ